MIVYLSNPYGTIPGEKWREYRFYLLGKALAEQGHEVIWFTSTFSHHFKYQRATINKVIKVSQNFKIHLIKSSSYKKNISLGRIIRDFTYGLNLSKQLKKIQKPELFIIADSPITLYYPSYFYCRRQKIPFVIDQMDLWPELIVNSFNPLLKSIFNLLFSFHYKHRKKVLGNASGFIALAKKYYEIPLSQCKSISKIPNAIIYNGIDVYKFREDLNKKSFDFEKLLPQKRSNDIWSIFAGTLGPSYDIETILLAFKKLKSKNNLKLIIVGDGSQRGMLESFLRKNKTNNIFYLGKLNKEQLISLYSKCDIGLNTYGKYSNVEMSDKFYDYTSAGLAIINSLDGEVHDLLETYKLGVNYNSNDVESFITSFKTLTKDKNKLEVIKKNSYSIAINFDQTHQLNLFKQFFKNLSDQLFNEN